MWPSECEFRMRDQSQTMADALISLLLRQLASITAREAEQEIRLVVGVDEEIRKLEGNL